MKVAFLIHSLEVNSCRYRVLQYLPYFKKQGIDASIHFYKRSWVDKLTFYNTIGQYDLFFIHRKLFLPMEFWWIRRKAKKIIYDFDDALMYRSSGSSNPHSFSRRARFAYMMRRVDCVIAGNQFLKSEVLPYNRQVEVIPTSIDVPQYTLKEDLQREGPITIGWLGSSSTLKYLKDLIPMFEKLYQKSPNFQVKIVCDQFLDDFDVPVNKKQWSIQDEESDLKSFDIGVMPLSDDLWSKGKCGLKILQYYSVGVPVVCTPVGVNGDIVVDGVNGFWARGEGEWEDRLLTLIRDKGLRRKMGRLGRSKVEKGYSIEVNAPRMIEVFKKVLSQ